MSYLMLARIGKAIMTPFKLINTVMKGEKGEDFLIYARGILVFAVLIICCVTSSPDSLMQWLLIIYRPCHLWFCIGYFRLCFFLSGIFYIHCNSCACCDL